MLLLKVWKPSRTFRFEGEPESNLSGSGYPASVVLRAWGPYIVLAVFVFFWGLGSFKAILNGLPGTVFNISWPGLDGEVMKTAPIVQADAVYGAKFTFNWLSAGGTAILLSGLVSVPFMPKYSFGKAVACFFSTIYQLRFPVLTIATIVFVSLATSENDDDPKGIVLTADTFKTSGGFAVASYAVMIIVAVLYAVFW